MYLFVGIVIEVSVEFFIINYCLLRCDCVYIMFLEIFYLVFKDYFGVFWNVEGN